MTNPIHLVGVFSLLVATLFLIIVSVGLPIWKDVYFLSVDISASALGRSTDSPDLRMGTWGLCFGGEVCTKSKLGYSLSFIEDHTSGTARVVSSIVHGLTYALVLNPIAAGFSFIALLFSLSTHFVVGVLASIMSGVAFLVTLLAFALDFSLFVTAKHRLDDLSTSSSTFRTSLTARSHYGPAMWLVLVAFLLQLLASVTMTTTIFNAT
ncbi:pali-domain-containing protein [Meredithblackwellia eburnea MCA 4105]